MRPIRFVTGGGNVADRERLLTAARRAEEVGYSTFAMADHFGLPFAPLLALQAVADATTTLRVAQTVLAHDFRHPAVLAEELATLDVLSGGRAEIGVGAGWMQSEYEQAGISFDPAPVRIARLEEFVVVLKGLLGEGPFSVSGEYFSISGLDGSPKTVQRPRPPILIGGGGKKLLAVAARHADIIQVLPRIPAPGQPIEPTELMAPTFGAKIDHIKAIAGERFQGIELGTQLLLAAITDDPQPVLDEFAAKYAVSADDLRASPVVAVGSEDEVCEKLLGVRAEYGISYFAAPVGIKPSSLAPIIARLAGT